MKNFRYETPILYRIKNTNLYQNHKGELVISDWQLFSVFEFEEILEIPKRISFSISSRPTKQSIPIKIRRVCDSFSCDGFSFDVTIGRSRNSYKIYSGFRWFLMQHEPFKSVRCMKAIKAHLTLYIHSK
jgi:hypothetical protein